MKKCFKVLALVLVSLVLFVNSLIAANETSAWKIDYHVDEFFDKTDKPYVTQSKGYTEGVYSDSATNNSPAYALFIIEANAAYVELFRYKDKELRFPVSLYRDKVHVKIQSENEGRIDLGSFESTGKRICITNNSKAFDQLYNLFINNPSFKIRIEISKYSDMISAYNFAIPTNGFEKAYFEAFGVYPNDEAE